ncbi:KamA family protein, partial [Bacteroides sp. OttesenSCG-928-F21]|nr:KamA family protein [Bacteroides sp. OttesenSCG-928-F21]
MKPMMKQKKILPLSLVQLHQLFKTDLPELTSLAVKSSNENEFKEYLNDYFSYIEDGEAKERVELLMKYDGKDIYELSTEKKIRVSTLSYLWQFLTDGKSSTEHQSTDL